MLIFMILTQSWILSKDKDQVGQSDYIRWSKYLRDVQFKGLINTFVSVICETAHPCNYFGKIWSILGINWNNDSGHLGGQGGKKCP